MLLHQHTLLQLLEALTVAQAHWSPELSVAAIASGRALTSCCGVSLQANSSSGGSLSVNAVLACARNYAALWLRHKNPFIDHTQEPAGDSAVLTFEVSFSNVVGMDFRWPLTEEPRLVLEAACLCKRVFDSVRAFPHSLLLGCCMRGLDLRRVRPADCGHFEVSSESLCCWIACAVCTDSEK